MAVEVEHCGKLLSKWNKGVFGNIQHNIMMKEVKLERLLLEVQDIFEAIKIEACRKELNELSLREKILWKQRAKITWLKKEDRNTMFFFS